MTRDETTIPDKVPAKHEDAPKSNAKVRPIAQPIESHTKPLGSPTATRHEVHRTQVFGSPHAPPDDKQRKLERGQFGAFTMPQQVRAEFIATELPVEPPERLFDLDLLKAEEASSAQAPATQNEAPKAPSGSSSNPVPGSSLDSPSNNAPMATSKSAATATTTRTRNAVTASSRATKHQSQGHWLVLSAVALVLVVGLAVFALRPASGDNPPEDFPTLDQALPNETDVPLPQPPLRPAPTSARARAGTDSSEHVPIIPSPAEPEAEPAIRSAPKRVRLPARAPEPHQSAAPAPAPPNPAVSTPVDPSPFRTRLIRPDQ